MRPLDFLMPLGFLGLAVLPVIVAFYMLKKKTTPLTVPSILLWERLNRLTSTAFNINKILKNILLYLQLLAALLIVLALANPMMRMFNKNDLDAVIIIDTSISMAVTHQGISRLEEGISIIESLVDKKGSISDIAIIAAGNNAEIISGLTKSKNQLKASLANIKITTEQPNISEAFLLAHSLVEQLEGANIILVSDGNFGEIDYTVPNFTYMAVGKQGVQNLYIENMVVEGTRLQVTVGNNGDEHLSTFVGIYDHEGNLVGRRQVQLNGGSVETYIWRNLPPSPWFKGELELNDQLLEDNTIYGVNIANTNNRILLVTEGNPFLEKALLLNPDAQLSKVESGKYQDGLSTQFDIYVFDGFLPEKLPDAPILVFDPPYPSEHFTLSTPKNVSNIYPSQSKLLSYTEFDDVTIHFSKTMEQGRAVLGSNVGNIIVEIDNQGYPLVVFGFPIQAGDFHLRPAFPIMLLNIMDYFKDHHITLDNFNLYQYPTFAPPLGVTSLEMRDPNGNLTEITGTFPKVGDRLEEVGVYEITLGENPLFIPVNYPRNTGSLEFKSAIPMEDGAVEGDKIKGNTNIAWIFIVLALILLCAEWWVDTYVY